MGMSGQERKTWLRQVEYIYYEEKRLRDMEMMEQAAKLATLRQQVREYGSES